VAKKRKRPTAPPPPVRKAPPRPAAASGARATARSAAARADSRAALRRRALTAALVLLAAVAVMAYVVVDRQRGASLTQELTAGTCEVDADADRTGPPGQNHVPSPTYTVNPPAGGDHLPGAARAGVYDGARVPEDGLLVHSLEHGYVVYWHTPELPQDQREELVRLQEQRPEDVIVVERPGMPVPVAATSWGRRLLCEQVEADPLDRFAQEYVGTGPEDVPRG
jgi:hypothetical protein